MNDIPNSDLPLWEALPDLTLNIAQTAALCGVSVRQLGYWTRQGYVAASGQGARRTYGLEAIRRILAIRKAMEAGASLRQSLRQLPDALPKLPDALPKLPDALPKLPDALPTAMPLGAPASAIFVSAPPIVPSPAAAVLRSLAAFFAVNVHTRDHAGGLAVKLGWAEDDVRQAADSLCTSGLLGRSVCQGMTVFHRSEKGIAHA